MRSALGYDLHGHDRVDLMEQVDPDLVRADRSDRLVEVHIASVDRDTFVLRGDRVGDVLGRDRAEELTSSPARAVTRIGPPEISRDAIASYSPLRAYWRRSWARRRFSACWAAPLGLHGDRPRDQVVACVAVGNLDHVSGVSRACRRA